jgi:hypothetical protein
MVEADPLPVGQPTVEVLEVAPRESEPLVVPEAIEEPHSVNVVEPVETQEKLPLAPESTVPSGETPSSAVALSRSEPVMIAHVDEEENETQPADPKSNGSTDSPVPEPEPMLESLSPVSGVPIAEPDVQHGAIASPNH